MHLSNAGICFIDKVLKYKPDLCFVDFFSTAYCECSYKTLEYIDTIFYRLSSNNCALVFLFLPEERTEKYYEKRIPFYDFLKKAIIERNGFYIDIDNELSNVSLSDLLRDSVHTTTKGAECYSKIIQKYLIYNFPSVLNPNIFFKNAVYREIKELKVNRVFNKNLILNLDGEIIGIFNTIGCHSGICNIKNDKGNVTSYLLWDRWCYYERNHFNFAIPNYKGLINIEILQDNFDTSLCV